MGVLNLVHELMHSFGAKHDPETASKPECTPDDKVILYFKSFEQLYSTQYFFWRNSWWSKWVYAYLDPELKKE